MVQRQTKEARAERDWNKKRAREERETIEKMEGMVKGKMPPYLLFNQQQQQVNY